MSTPLNNTEVSTSYFDKRMQELGITPEINQVALWKNVEGKSQLVPVPIFRPHEKGIEIVPYYLDRRTIRIDSISIDENGHQKGSKWKKDWSIIRHEKPIQTKNGPAKYTMPKGKGSFPFFPPNLLKKYDDKQPIDILYLTEGYFKAFKGDMHGIDIVGLPSITHLKDKEKGTLHPDVLQLMNTCNVRRMVWLTDGDCLDIPTMLKEDMTGKDKDLYQRPASFFSTVITFKQLLEEHPCDKYFVHIDIDSIRAENSNITRDQVKGLDDLLISFSEQIPEIIQDLHTVGKPGFWFQKFNITHSVFKVKKHFHIDTVTDFYSFHSERRPELKGQEFIYRGTRYLYNEEKAECEVKIPVEASRYFRVGDNYFKWIQRKNVYGVTETHFRGRQKSTISDDHGKNFFKNIAKYEDFCNLPDHVNYERVIDGCFNVYNPLEHEPLEEECTEEDCPNIIAYMKHLFGESVIKFHNPKTKQQTEYLNYELGLDYVQLLYQQPAQKLPILCLVSKENNTGKSTFGKLMRQMFGGNCAIVGNQDLAGDFNAHWSTKLLVICDETKIDKQHVVEKVKSLSTADKIMMNAKGKDHTEIDCFIKFMFITNNESNFIYVTDEDIRYWIVKVPVLREENPNILDQMIEEIPAFLAMLNRRKMATEKLNRMWFHPNLIKTEALKKVVAFSKSTIEKELRQYLKDAFLDFGVNEILMTRKAIHKEVFNNRYEANYLEKVLKEELRVDMFHKLDPAQPDAFGGFKKIYVTKRHSYPKYERRFNTDLQREEMVRVEIEDQGRPYVFKKEMFIDENEDKVEHSEETLFTNAMLNTGSDNSQPATGTGGDELPF
jgi:hypothetical protein